MCVSLANPATTAARREFAHVPGNLPTSPPIRHDMGARAHSLVLSLCKPSLPLATQPGTEEKILIGYQARFAEEDSLAALDAATKSWNMGRGEWAQASPAHRIAKVQELVAELKPLRDQIINVLMWEICKTKADATKEFDRTMDFIADLIKTYKGMLESGNKFIQEGGVLAQVKRGPIGVMLNLGPFNYPFNETYCTLIPAILMGNSVVMKLPNVGCLAHICTMEVYARVFPPGVVNFISGGAQAKVEPSHRLSSAFRTWALAWPRRERTTRPILAACRLPCAVADEPSGSLALRSRPYHDAANHEVRQGGHLRLHWRLHRGGCAAQAAPDAA